MLCTSLCLSRSFYNFWFYPTRARESIFRELYKRISTLSPRVDVFFGVAADWMFVHTLADGEGAVGGTGLAILEVQDDAMLACLQDGDEL